MTLRRIENRLLGALLRLDAPKSYPALFLMVLPLFVLLYFPTGLLSGNEENYLQLAFLRVSGVTYGPYDVLEGGSALKFLSDVLIGIPILALGYESAYTLLRLALASAICAAFVWMVRPWSRSFIDVVLPISAFWLLEQQLFGGEWILGGIEGKGFAYTAVFVGIGCLTRRRYAWMTFFFVLATYFHFLVGGFWWAVSCVGMYARERDLRAVGLVVASFLAAIAPLLIFGIIEQRSALPHGYKGPSPDVIYSIIRNPHHVAPFSSRYLAWSWLPGFAALGSFILGLLFLRRYASSPPYRFLVNGCIFLLSYLLFALLLSFGDAKTGYFGKLYLFRPSSLTLLLCLIAFVTVLRSVSRKATFPMIALVSVVILPFTYAVAAKEAVDEYREHRASEGLAKKLLEALDSLTSSDDVVVLQPGKDGSQPYVSIRRKVERPMLVNWKFVPTTPAGIVEWYKRVEFRDRVFAYGCSAPMEYPIDYLIIRTNDSPDDEVVRSCGKRIWSSDNLAIVEVSAN